MMLFGWCADTIAGEQSRIGRAMGEALRVHSQQHYQLWTMPGIVVGQFRMATLGDRRHDEAIRVEEGPYSLWMAGEAFSWGTEALAGAAESHTEEFRHRLLRAILKHGEQALESLNGEYQIALWDSRAQLLRLWTDRFSALPIYWAKTGAGVAFAGGVRGVVMAPGVSLDPDPDAIREAVSFGGFRLGDRTNLQMVKMAPAAASLTISKACCGVKRYWTWDRLGAPGDASSADSLLERIRGCWPAVIRRRLDGASRPGLTLSGGLDSRAILAEGTRQHVTLSALTYGVPGCDDVRFAKRAARAAGAPVAVHALYGEDWFERRLRHIHETDGLMEFVDLMHTEAVDSMPALFDVCLSGYGGDTFSGGTYEHVNDAPSMLTGLPYYGGRLGMPYEAALARAEQMLEDTHGAPRFAVFDHKLPQAISRISHSVRPYVRVRRPFMDYELFELCHLVPRSMRASHRWHEQWLLSTYPEFYRSIPNQKTGSPISASSTRRKVTRVARYAWRRSAAALKTAGVPVQVPQRSFHPDEPYWQSAPVRARMEATIMRTGALSCEVLGRDRVKEALQAFFTSGDAAIQAIGALFVFEHYHATLPDIVTAARARAEEGSC